MAGSRSLGSLTLDLILKLGGFTAGLTKAERDLQRVNKQAYAFGRSIGGALRSAATSLLAFAGVTVTVGTAVHAMFSALDRAEQLHDLSIQTGISAEKLSDLSFAAKQTGVDAEQLSKALGLLSKNATLALDPKSKQAGLFEALGVSKDALTDLDKLIPQVADAFKALPDGPIKAATAMKLFGRAGKELIELFSSGSIGLEEFTKRARELGLEISSNTANQADELKDKIRELKEGMSGFVNLVVADLLPDLIKMVDGFSDATTKGDGLTNAAHATADGIRATASAIREASAAISEFLGLFSSLGSGITGLQNKLDAAGRATHEGILSLFTGNADAYHQAVEDYKNSSNDVIGIVEKAKKAVSKPADTPTFLKTQLFNPSGFDATKGAFNATGTPSTVSTSGVEDALKKFYGGKGPSKSSASGGKSDAERQADKVKVAIEGMTKAQQAWEAELGQTGNPIVDDYNSRLADLDEQAKGFAKDGVDTTTLEAWNKKMKELAESHYAKDLAAFQKDFNQQTAETAAQLAGPTAEALQTYGEELKKIDDLLATHQINLESYNARKDQLLIARDSPFASLNQDIQEQIKLLGMTNEQQEIYNNLKTAGVTADSAFGQQITESTIALQKMREQVAFTDELKAGLSNLFVDFVSGAKTAKEAFGDFADAIYARALQFVADKAIQALFDAFSSSGTAATTSSSSPWAGALAAIFGGARAFGGPVSGGKLYEVGEGNRPETFFSGGRQWMIPGNSGMITPGVAGRRIEQNFYTMGIETRRTQERKAQLAGREANRSLARNG